LLHRLLAAREAARILLDGGAHGRAARLRLRQVVRLAGELLLALAQPLAVLHQRLPLVAQPREHALELHAQRPLAGRAGPLGPRLLEHPHLLLQLLPPLAVRLEPRPHLFLLLHPVRELLAHLLLGRDQLALRFLQLAGVLLRERGRLLDRREPPLALLQLAQQHLLAVHQRAPPLRQPRPPAPRWAALRAPPSPPPARRPPRRPPRDPSGRAPHPAPRPPAPYARCRARARARGPGRAPPASPASAAPAPARAPPPRAPPSPPRARPRRPPCGAAPRPCAPRVARPDRAARRAALPPRGAARCGAAARAPARAAAARSPAPG